jgi:CheY-like chemotaxis protein
MKTEYIKLDQISSGLVPDLQNRKILLAEDTEINRKLVLKVLEGTNCIVDCAENGKVCIEKSKQSSYDWVIMDLEMPKMNGYEATNYIRIHLNLNIPIIAISANANSKERDKCIYAGMNDYLSKPFKAEFLYLILKEHIGNKSSKVKYKSTQGLPKPNNPPLFNLKTHSEFFK